MSGSLYRNLAITLGIFALVLGGYYFYAQSPVSSPNAFESEQALQTSLAKTAIFISHSQDLDQINLDLSLFEDKRFLSLRLYTAPVKEQSTGRSNPFSETNQ